MNEFPRVTIGLPVYNGEKYLTETLNTLLGQTFGDFELIIADNASTDGTETLCRAFAAQDPRIRYERSAVNKGATWNYNRLVDLARGEYFRWAAHDDLCTADHLEKCVAILDDQPEVVLCFSQTLLIDDDSKPIEVYLDRYSVQANTPHDRLREFFRGGGLCNPVFGLMRTETLRRTTMIESYVDSDRTLLGQLAILGQLYRIPEPLFIRRIHAQTSVAVNPDRKSRLTWFDPKKRTGFQLPRWRRVGVYSGFIRSMPLPWREKLACYGVLYRHFFGHPGWIYADIYENFRPSFRGSDVHNRLGISQRSPSTHK